MAVPPSRSALRPSLAVGDVLAGRYLLTRRVHPESDLETGSGTGSGTGTVLWQADDEILARPVGIRLMPAGGRRAAAAQRFLDAAAKAGALDLPVFARVYDAALEERPAERGGRRAGTLDVAYVIREWVVGKPLDEALRAGGPLEPAEAVRLVIEAARGLEVAAARGATHGRLHPRNVVLSQDGRLKLLDLGLAAALHPGAPAEQPVAQDTVDLAAVLYAMVTGRWPGSVTDQPAGALPAAPAREGRLERARSVHAGVPRALDDVLAAVLSPERPGSGPQTPGALVRALEQAQRAMAEASAPTPSRLPPAVRRRLPLLLVGAFLLLVGITSFTVGLRTGAVENTDDALDALVEPSAAPASDTDASGTPVDLLGGAQVRDFDPPPGDGRENAGAVPNAFDGDATTAWETERYSSAQLGGLKPGVGLLVDLGAPTAVTQVELGVRPGTAVELRAADEVADAIDAFPVVATAEATGELVRLDTGTTARYWLVLLTSLPAESGGFRGSVAEMRFVRG